MAYPRKLATCCHCGTKAVLVLRGGRHELSCRSCGAPLSAFKRLPLERPERPAVSHLAPPLSIGTVRVSERKAKEDEPRRRRPARFKKVKRWVKWAVEEVVDELEDLFD